MPFGVSRLMSLDARQTWLNISEQCVKCLKVYPTRDNKKYDPDYLCNLIMEFPPKYSLQS